MTHRAEPNRALLIRRLRNSEDRLQRLIDLDAPPIVLRNEQRLRRDAVRALINDREGAPDDDRTGVR